MKYTAAAHDHYEQLRRGELTEAALAEWGKWRRTADKAGIGYPQNLIDRMRGGSQWWDQRDLTQIAAVEHAVQVLTLIRPEHGGALHAHYVFVPDCKGWRAIREARRGWWNCRLHDLNPTQFSEPLSWSSYERALREAKTAITGFLLGLTTSAK